MGTRTVLRSALVLLVVAMPGVVNAQQSSDTSVRPTGQHLASTDADPMPPAQAEVFYTVQRGDTLSGIAVKYYRSGSYSNWNNIYEANRDQVQNPHRIQVGQRLRIPQAVAKTSNRPVTVAKARATRQQQKPTSEKIQSPKSSVPNTNAVTTTASATRQSRTKQQNDDSFTGPLWQLAAHKYRDHFQKMAVKYGIRPDYAVAMGMIESSLFQGARSPKGAIGIMQLMPATARRYRLDPYDPYENIEAGIRYFADLLRMFDGNVDLAVAAYNAGEQAVLNYLEDGKHCARRKRRNQACDGMPPYRETRNHVRRFHIAHDYLTSQVESVPAVMRCNLDWKDRFTCRAGKNVVQVAKASDQQMLMTKNMTPRETLVSQPVVAVSEARSVGLSSFAPASVQTVSALGIITIPVP